jgi:hypothetical protein
MEFCPECCALVVSTNQKIHWHKRSESFKKYWIEPGSTINENTYAFDYFKGKTVPSGMRNVPASAWISNERFPNNTIKEESFFLPRYNSVITLLWIEDNEPEDEDFDF